MRSRYSAFVRHDEAYLLRTWHPATRPESVAFDPDLRWTGLTIVRAEPALVEFRAEYVAAGTSGVLHEVSRFLKDDSAWLYVRGKLISR